MWLIYYYFFCDRCILSCLMNDKKTYGQFYKINIIHMDLLYISIRCSTQTKYNE